MEKEKPFWHILLTSLVMTLIVFSIGILISYLLDFQRIDEINILIQQHELDNEAFLLEQGFDDNANPDCGALRRRLASLNEEIIQVGKELSSYGDKSIFRKNDFDFLRRKYFLLQLKFYAMILDINDRCGRTYIPVLFFYEADDRISERQGFILDDIADSYKGEVIVVSIDKDYQKEPLVAYLVDKYNITTAPSIVINGNLAFDRLVYTGELNGTILRIRRQSDPYAREHDFDYIFRATGADKQAFVDYLIGLAGDTRLNNFSRADALFMAGRLTRNDTLMCSSLQFFESFFPSGREEQALIYETYASIGCGRNRKAFLLEAAELWDSLGSHFRASLDRKLAAGEAVDFTFANVSLAPELENKIGAERVIIGISGFDADRDDLIITQADRVSRDWLSYQLNESPFSEKILTLFSERLYMDVNELLPGIGWHEGGRLNMIEQAGIPRTIASGTIAVRRGARWYAPNEQGVFMFEVPLDKVLYPSTRFLREDIAVIIDTHGVNMMVEQAMRLNATLVIGCCDHPGKVAAARYLADRGRKVVCFTDKYLPLILGYNGSVLASAPFSRNGNRVTFGKRPVAIGLDEIVIASNVTDYSAVQSYYDTPARYFSILSDYYDMPLRYFDFTENNQTYMMAEAARIFNATVIGARVFSRDDYYALRQWLAEDRKNRAVLFHSYSYPYGYKLMEEFPEQTTFGDINPILI